MTEHKCVDTHMNPFAWSVLPMQIVQVSGVPSTEVNVDLNFIKSCFFYQYLFYLCINTYIFFVLSVKISFIFLNENVFSKSI